VIWRKRIEALQARDISCCHNGIAQSQFGSAAKSFVPLSKVLTLCLPLDTLGLMKSKFFTTAEAAAKIGISRATLYNWIRSGLVEAPEPIRLGVRLWTASDIAKAAAAKGTIKLGRPRARKRKERYAK
jgi:predicted DNA-binding transcriptional regulator AlpA